MERKNIAYQFRSQWQRFLQLVYIGFVVAKDTDEDSSARGGGVGIDPDTTQNDKLGGTVLWLTS